MTAAHLVVGVSDSAPQGQPRSLLGNHSQIDDNMHMCDWYATFCTLAGVDPADNATGIPPIDSIVRMEGSRAKRAMFNRLK